MASPLEFLCGIVAVESVFELKQNKKKTIKDVQPLFDRASHD
ncbi:MAG TPA: hypothetical protein VHU84_07475 [Lacipirellulaceae bacterium]|jgi:hypothetical protein|nr:hypothetical protein [Lacipirellulaceae bacterium]